MHCIKFKISVIFLITYYRNSKPNFKKDKVNKPSENLTISVNSHYLHVIFQCQYFKINV